MQVRRSRLRWSLLLTRQQVSWGTFILCVCLAFSNVGCDIIGLSEDDSGGIDHEVEFRLAEESAVSIGSEPPNVPELFFTMQTKKNLGCGAFQILHDVEQTGEEVVIRVLEIKEPKLICLGPEGPATARFKLPLDPGKYTLTLINGKVRDQYTATVTNQRVKLTSEEADWTEPTAMLYWRHPRNSFVYYCGATPETKSLCTDFEARLQELPLTRIEVPEEGQWPYPLVDDGHHYSAPPRFYRYPDQQTWKQVKTRLRSFIRDRVQGREGVGMEVWNWLSDRVLSWRLTQQ